MPLNQDLLAKVDEIIPARNDAQFKVVSTLGSGSFGAIYRVERTTDGTLFAMKIEPLDCKKQMLKVEYQVMKCANKAKSPFFCQALEKGIMEGRFAFIIMQLVYKNLWHLRAEAPDHCFSLNTALRTAEQCLASVRDLHGFYYLHRDIKPPNFAIGRKEDKKLNTVFMLDFGLCRKFRTHDGLIKKSRTIAPFRGTTRYASCATLRNEEQCMKDDIEAWFYMVVEFTIGILPWHNIKEREDVLAKKNEWRKKEIFDEHMKKGPVKEFRKILDYIDSLSYESIPDYSGLYSILKKIGEKRKLSRNEPLDWGEAILYNGPPFEYELEAMTKGSSTTNTSTTTEAEGPSPDVGSRKGISPGQCTKVPLSSMMQPAPDPTKKSNCTRKNKTC